MNCKCRFRKEAHPKGNPKEGIGFWGWVICLRFRSPKAALAASCTRCGLSRRLAYWPSLPSRVPALWLCGCYVIVLYCLTFCTLGSLFGLPFVHAVEQLEWCLARANVERNPKSPTCPAYNPRSSCGRDAICGRAERTSSQFHIRFWACDLTAGSQDKERGVPMSRGCSQLFPLRSHAMSAVSQLMGPQFFGHPILVGDQCTNQGYENCIMVPICGWQSWHDWLGIFRRLAPIWAQLTVSIGSGYRQA